MPQTPRSRSKRRRREGFVVGAFPTLKLNVDAVPYASLLELDVLYFLEYDPSVISYTRRPLEILISPPHKPAVSYTPDYLVVRETYQELVMISPKERITSDTAQEHIELYTVWAHQRGHRFRVFTEEDVRVGHALTNIKLLWRYSRLTVSADVTMRCISYLNLYPEGSTLSALAAYLSEDHPMIAAPYVYHLLYHHILQADLNEPLTPQSSIWFTPAASVIEHHVS